MADTFQCAEKILRRAGKIHPLKALSCFSEYIPVVRFSAGGAKEKQRFCASAGKSETPLMRTIIIIVTVQPAELLLIIAFSPSTESSAGFHPRTTHAPVPPESRC